MNDEYMRLVVKNLFDSGIADRIVGSDGRGDVQINVIDAMRRGFLSNGKHREPLQNGDKLKPTYFHFVKDYLKAVTCVAYDVHRAPEGKIDFYKRGVVLDKSAVAAFKLGWATEKVRSYMPPK